MASPTTILFAGGGTGGHLYPGISVAQALIQRAPNIKPIFLCTTRPIDRTILEPTGFEFIEQPIVPPTKSVGGLLKFFTTWRTTKDLLRKIIKENRPAAILGLGGYAAGPAVKYAAHKGVPAAILNPDVIPGKANQYLLRYVAQVYSQFEATRAHLPASHQNKMIVTGCPIRDEMQHLPSREDACQRLGIDPTLKTLTITGASQGAQTVNDAILESLNTIKLQGWNILHLAGKDHANAVRTEYRNLGIPAIVIEFTSGMSDIWAVTDLCIGRSGASTCAELTACGIPSILFPYPFHKDMHQRANAKVLADAGAAVLLKDAKDRKINGEQLSPVLQSLLYDATKRSDMSEKAKQLSHPNASDQVAQALLKLAKIG